MLDKSIVCSILHQVIAFDYNNPYILSVIKYPLLMLGLAQVKQKSKRG